MHNLLCPQRICALCRQPALRERCRAQIEALRAQEARVVAVLSANQAAREQAATVTTDQAREVASLLGEVSASEAAADEEQSAHAATRLRAAERAKALHSECAAYLAAATKAEAATERRLAEAKAAADDLTALRSNAGSAEQTLETLLRQAPYTISTHSGRLLSSGPHDATAESSRKQTRRTALQSLANLKWPLPQPRRALLTRCVVLLE